MWIVAFIVVLVVLGVVAVVARELHCLFNATFIKL